MGKCFAPECSHRSERDACTFFRLPKSPGLRSKWLRALNRSDGKQPKGSGSFCSCHFPDKNKRRTPKFSRAESLPSAGLRSTPKEVRTVGTWGARRKLDLNQSRNEDATNDSIDGEVVMSCPVNTSGKSPWKVTSMKCTPEMYAEAQLLIALGNSGSDTPNVDTESVDDSVLDSEKELSTPLENDNESLHDTINKLKKETEELLILREEKKEWTSELVKVKEENEKYCHQLNAISQELSEVAQERNAYKEEMLKLKEEKAGLLDELKVQDLQFSLCNIWNFLLEDKLKTDKSKETTVTSEVKSVCTSLESQKAGLEEEMERLKSRIGHLEKELSIMLNVSEVLKMEKESLTKELQSEKERMCFKNVCTDDNISHFIGIPNINTFYWLLSMVPENLEYCYKSKVKCLCREDQLFLTLFQLRQNPSHLMLGAWFGVSRFVVSNVIHTWVSALHTILVMGFMKEVPSLQKIKLSMPESFKEYPNCRMIIDCTEVTCQIPHSMKKQNLVYSSYKGRTTFKGLKGIAPNGTTVYVSELYPDSTSDKVIVEKCGVLNVFQPGDAVMADKGFLIKDILPPGVELNLPPFKETAQFTRGQIMETLKIARSRIHVERAIERQKRFHVLDKIPSTMFPFVSEIFQVTGALCNLMRPLILEVEEAMRNYEES